MRNALIGAGASIAVALVAWVFFLGGLSERVDTNKRDVSDVRSELRDFKDKFIRPVIAEAVTAHLESHSAQLVKSVVAASEFEKRLRAIEQAPPGTIVAWPLTAPPDGWLICDGTAKPREGRYAALAKTMEGAGFPWGAGDGSSTFDLPDFRGLFLRGADDPDATGPLPGAGRDASPRLAVDWASAPPADSIASVQSDAVGKHHHASRHGAMVVLAPGGVNINNPGQPGHNATLAKATQDAGGPETCPKNAYVNFIIKY